MNVSCKTLLLLVTSATLLSGCEEPSVSVSSLGRKLAAPVLTSSSPFDQDMDTQGYVHITGTCDKRVGPVSLSFDDSTYHYAPSAPNAAGTTLGSVTNDNDCADGKFDIYLTSADLLNIWNIDTNDDNDKVTNIFIKGETLFGDTHPLKIVDPKVNDPTQSGLPTKLALRKVFPEGFGGNNVCEMFNVVVTDNNGNETSARANVTFEIANDTGSGIAIYLSANDCASYYNGQTAVTITATTSSKIVYMRMPAAPVNAAVSFSLANLSVNTLTPATTSTPVVLRDPSSTRRFIAMTENPTTLYKNTCYPIVLQRMDYNKTSPYSSSALTLAVTPSDSKLQLFSESDCGSGFKISTVDFSSGVIKKTVYAKYAASTLNSTSFTNVKLNYTANDSNYDTPSFALRIDLSDKTEVKHADFWGPNNISRGSCHGYTFVTANANWTSVPADKNYTVSLASTQTLAGLEFYSDDICSMPISGSLTVTQGQVGAKFFAKATGDQNTAGQIIASIAGFSSMSRDYTLTVAATGYTMAMATPQTITKGQCNYIKFDFYDYYGPIAATNPLNLMFNTTNGTGNLVGIYADENCATTLVGENVLLPLAFYNSTTYKFYIKVDSSYSQSSLPLVFTGTSTFALPTIIQSFNIVSP